MHSDRLKVIESCIKSLYIRFRKKIPDDGILQTEIKLALRDLRDIPGDELKDAFAIAYRKHDKDRPPYTKEVLAHWKSSKSSFISNLNSCGRCASGLLSTLKEFPHPKDKERTYMKSFTFRCRCGAGNKMSQEFTVWDNQPGYQIA